MTDVSGVSAPHDYTSVFIAAMPPVLPSQTMTPSSPWKPAGMLTSSTDVARSYLYASMDPSVRGSWAVVKPRAVHCGGVCWGREMEAALLRREMKLQRELNRQRHTEYQRRQREHAEVLARQAEEQQRRECEWDGRLQKVLQEHMKETLGLREEIEREQQLVARSEEQLTETRAQLTQLHSKVVEMWQQKKESETLARETETASLTEIHQKALERLQRVFEEDKLQTKQWFTEELQRVQSVHEKLRTDADDAHRQQLRRMEADMTELQRRLRDTEAEAQQYKARAAAAALKPAVPSADEVRAREDLRALRVQLSEALDSKVRADRRATDAEREADERGKSLQVLQMEFDALIARHDVERRSLREANQDLTDELTRTRTAHAEEMENLQKNVRNSEGVTSRETAKEFEARFRRMNERYDDMRRTLEVEKTQLTKRLKEIEQQHDDAQRRLRQQTEQVEELRSEGIRQKQQNTEKDRLIAELRFSIEDLKQTGGTVADLTTRNRELQQEAEQRRREHEAAVQVMDSNVQELRRERDAAQVRVTTLLEELSASQRAHSESETRCKKLLDEAELRERQLRRETEEARQNVESLKEHCNQLQMSAAAAAVAAPKTHNLLHEKDTELARLRSTIEAVKHDRDTLEQQLREEHVTITKKERELYEKQMTLERLNMEVLTLREQLHMATNYSQPGMGQPFMKPTQHSLFTTKPGEGLPCNEQHTPPHTITSPEGPLKPSAVVPSSVPIPIPAQMSQRSPSVPSSVSPAGPPVPSAVVMPTQVSQSPSATCFGSLPIPAVTGTVMSPPSNVATSVGVPMYNPNVFFASSRQEAAPVFPVNSPSIPFVDSSQQQSYNYGSLVEASKRPQSVVIPTPLVTAVPSSSSSPAVGAVSATSTFGGVSPVPTPVPVSVLNYNKDVSKSQMQTWGPVPVPVPEPVPVTFGTTSAHSKENEKRGHKEHRHREHRQK